MSELRIGLQMISVKDVTPKDIIGVMEEVARLGYEGVEFARGFFGRTADEIKAACDRLNLLPVSNHVFIELMREDINAVIRDCKLLNMPYIAFPGPGMNTFHAPEEDIARLIGEIHRMAERFKADGIQCILHSPMELYEKDQQGRVLFDRILEEIPTELLQAQIDTAWALVGGMDPADMIRRYAGRTDIVHIKDFKPPIPTQEVMAARRDAAYLQDAEVGDGVQDVPRILRACKESGVKWVIVEHMEKDVYEDSIRSVGISLNHIRDVLKSID